MSPGGEFRGTTGGLGALPKAELHVHLDGSLRPSTMLELAAERGLTLPADNPAALASSMLVGRAGSLEAYLARFKTTLALMQDAVALDRIAYELAADHAAENVRHLEVRFCPALCTDGGLAGEAVLESVLSGLARARMEHEVESAVIVSALRSLPVSSSLEMAELAVAYRAEGVCGFDLAGAEDGHPVREHVDALKRASLAGVPVTIHAGEGYGPASIREAVDLGGASRIGHGTRLGEDPTLLRGIRDAGIPLEVCLTSNVQTGVAQSYRAHPLRRYFDEGIAVCLCTDNRLMSGVTLVDEYEHAREELAFTWEELVTVARAGFAHAFAPDEVRTAMLSRFESAVSEIG